jgi:cytoskeleton protein RodZ
METEATMTNEQTQKSTFNTNIVMHGGLGNRLRATRESLRISEKDAAARLRLNPRIIPLMENEDFDNDLPPTFMRGYLRSYMRMLNIPEEEINTTVSRIETTLPQDPTANSPPILSTRPANQSYRYLRMMTYVVPVVLAALVCSWWVSHPKDTMTLVKAITPIVKTSAPVSPSITTAVTPPPAAAIASQPVVPIVPSTATKPAIDPAPADSESDESDLSSAAQTTTVPEDVSATPETKTADAATSTTSTANAAKPTDLAPTKTDAESTTTPNVAAAPPAATTPETAGATTAEAASPVSDGTDSDTASDEPKPKHHSHKSNTEESNENVYTDY